MRSVYNFSSQLKQWYQVNFATVNKILMLLGNRSSFNWQKYATRHLSIGSFLCDSCELLHRWHKCLAVDGVFLVMQILEDDVRTPLYRGVYWNRITWRCCFQDCASLIYFCIVPVKKHIAELWMVDQVFWLAQQCTQVSSNKDQLYRDPVANREREGGGSYLKWCDV